MSIVQNQLAIANSELSALSPWYLGTSNRTTESTVIDPTRELFTEALDVFESELSKDPTKSQWIVDSKAGNLSEVLSSINAARTQYEARKGNSAVRRSLSNLAEKIHHYGNIMDVLVQHHPEYTSLAWGAMKVLFVGVVNHEKLLTRLSQGLCQISDVLPRLELTVRLFPTEAIKGAIVTMYAHILKFLIRAMRWFKESRLSHAIHSITRPSELRFDDLVEQIKYSSQSVAELASASSQAELRDLHIRQQNFIVSQSGFQHEQRKFVSNQLAFNEELKNRLLERDSVENKIEFLKNAFLDLRESIVSQQYLSLSAQFTVQHNISGCQIQELLSLLADSTDSSLLDPKVAFQSSLVLRNQRRQRRFSKSPSFWLDPKIQSWNQAQISSLVMIKGVRKCRFQIQDFLVDSISQLVDRNIPTIWMIKTALHYEDNEKQPTSIELLKNIISQAIKLNPSLHNDTPLSQPLSNITNATTESDYFDILASVIQALPLLYIFIDIELISISLNINAEFSIPKHFQKLFLDLEKRSVSTVIKVILVSYGSPAFGTMTSVEERNLVVSLVNTSKRTSTRIAIRNRSARGGRGNRRGASIILTTCN